MKFNPLSLVFSLLMGLAASRCQAAEISLDGQQFTLPDGFTIELVAGPPLTERPITGAFDEQGRLYVGESSGTNDKVQKQLAERPHASCGWKIPTATAASTSGRSSPTR